VEAGVSPTSTASLLFLNRGSGYLDSRLRASV
jgi:hypothetical protein